MRTKIQKHYEKVVFNPNVPEELKNALLDELSAAGYYLPYGRLQTNLKRGLIVGYTPQV